MHLDRLTLTNVRTFRDLDLSLEPGCYVVGGPNASGKSNLLEAITLLATARSSRARADVELISRQALRDDPLPGARLAAEVTTAAQPVSVELAVTAREPAGAGGRPPATGRRFRVNGIARRASDLIGQLRVVPFSADDLQIISGSPTQRRRYLDITISQLDVRYVRALQRYQRVLTQRNGLLRRLQERRGRGADELEFWDTELAAAGGVILAGRASALDALAEGMFVSSSYWSDNIGLTASITTIRELKRRNSAQRFEEIGESIRAALKEVLVDVGISGDVVGLFNAPTLRLDLPDESLRSKVDTLFTQELAKRGIYGGTRFMGTLAHTEEDIRETADAAREALEVIRSGLEGGLDELMEGEASPMAVRRIVR